MPWLPKEQRQNASPTASIRKIQGPCFGLADLVRTTLEQIIACYGAVEAGVDRVYVYDGSRRPESIRFLTRFLRDRCKTSRDRCLRLRYVWSRTQPMPLLHYFRRDGRGCRPIRG